MCLSISSYNDIHTDWSLYYKFVAKTSAQTKEHEKIEHSCALKGTHGTMIHACMHTPTCRHTYMHKHLWVIVLKFMGHLIYGCTLYVWIQYTNGGRPLSMGYVPVGGEKTSQRILFTDLASRRPLYTCSDLWERGRLDRRGEGKRGKKNCHFLALSRPIPPAPSRSDPSISIKSRRRPDDLRELLIWNFNTMIVLTIFNL